MTTYQQGIYDHQQGFTIVEVIITVVVTAIFIILFFTTYLAVEAQRVNVAQQAKASDIAYSNLRKFPSKPSVACNTVPATGLVISTSTYNFVPETDTQPLSNSTQTVTLYAPNGCDASNTTVFKDGVAKIISTVSYGNGQEASHATYIQ